MTSGAVKGWVEEVDDRWLSRAATSAAPVSALNGFGTRSTNWRRRCSLPALALGVRRDGRQCAGSYRLSVGVLSRRRACRDADRDPDADCRARSPDRRVRRLPTPTPGCGPDRAVPAPRDLTAERDLAIRRVSSWWRPILPGSPSVGVDDVAAGEKATNHLVNLERRRAHVCRSDHDGTSASRPRTGGRASPGQWRGSGWPPGRSRSRSARALAERRPRRCCSISAPPVFCASDELAAEMMSVSAKRGDLLGADLSIVGARSSHRHGADDIARARAGPGRCHAGLGPAAAGTGGECVVLPTPVGGP